MPVPTWTPGQVLTASDVNQWFVPLVAVKASDESVTSSTALQDDNDFLFSVVANAKYTFESFISYTGGAIGTADLKFTWAFPAGLTMKWGVIYSDTSSVLTLSIARIQTDTTTPGTSNVNERQFKMWGIVIVAGTAGTLKLQWAQNTSNATPTTLKANSYMILQRVA